MSASTMTSKGQITIPKKVRDLLHLGVGDKVEFIVLGSNEVLMKPITKKSKDVFGKLKKQGQKIVSQEEMDAVIRSKYKAK